MTTENHPIDQLVKERLGNFEQVPPAGLLDKINQEIAFRGHVRRMNRLKTISRIAAALVLIAMAGWYTIDLNKVAKNEFSEQIRPENPTARPVTGNGVLPAQTIDNNISINKKAGNTSSIQQIAKLEAPSRLKNKGSKTAASIAVQSTGKLPDTSVQSDERSPKKSLNEEAATVTKGEQKTETGSNAFQKKNEQNIYADSRLTPATPAPSSKRGNWSVRAEISPMFPSDKLGANSNAAAGTKSVSTLSGGMIASYQVNKRVRISSGIRFSQMKQGTHTDYTLSKTSGITYLQPVEKAANISRDVSLYLPSVSSIVYSNGMTAIATLPNPTYNFASDVSQNFKYLEIPIQATYRLIDQKQLTVGLTGGISTNFLIGNIASITQNGIKLSQGNTDNLRNVLYSGSAGIELGYDLGKNLVLTVEPRVKQYLHSVSSNDLINYRPLQLGIFTGITYTFY